MGWVRVRVGATCVCALAPFECRSSFPVAVSASRRRLRKTRLMLATGPEHTHTTTIVATLAAAAASVRSEPMEITSGSIWAGSPRSAVRMLAL